MNDPAALPVHWFVFRLGRLGDVTLCTGALEALARAFNWRFTMVTLKSFAPLFDNSPCVTSVISPPPELLAGRRWVSFCRTLAKEHTGSGLLDWHGTPRARVLSFFWRGPVLHYPKLSLERRLFLLSKGRFCGEALRQSNVPQRYYQSVASPPPPAHELLPTLHFAEYEHEAARQRLAALFGEQTRPVALHPFAAHSLKSWRPNRWRELTALLEGHGIPWIALGNDPAPSPFAGDRRNLCNSTTLRESCALLAHCRALVSGDSGPMHLATAAGTPVVALFGPTTREWGFYPAGPFDFVCELPLPCRPCSLHGKSSCPRNGQCLDALFPGDILNYCIDPTPSCIEK